MTLFPASSLRQMRQPGCLAWFSARPGAARVPDKFRDRALSLDSIRAAAAAAILGPALVIPAHYDGWAHFSEGRDDLIRAFDDAGQSAQLRPVDHGTWIALKP